MDLYELHDELEKDYQVITNCYLSYSLKFADYIKNQENLFLNRVLGIVNTNSFFKKVFLIAKLNLTYSNFVFSHFNKLFNFNQWNNLNFETILFLGYSKNINQKAISNPDLAFSEICRLEKVLNNYDLKIKVLKAILNSDIVLSQYHTEKLVDYFHHYNLIKISSVKNEILKDEICFFLYHIYCDISNEHISFNLERN